MARRRQKISKPRKETYAIIVDGETEVWYFQMLKRNEPFLQVNIEPKIPQKKELSDQFGKVCELAENYTKVFWIIDLDVIISESNVAKKGSTNLMEKLKNYLRKLEKDKYRNVITIINNPCLEFWFLLHFKQTTKYFLRCSAPERQLKKYLTNYEKSQEYFTKQNNDIYLKLKPHLKTAVNNSKNTNRKSLDKLESGICEMNLFFEIEQIKEIIS